MLWEYYIVNYSNLPKRHFNSGQVFPFLGHYEGTSLNHDYAEKCERMQMSINLSLMWIYWNLPQCKSFLDFRRDGGAINYDQHSGSLSVSMCLFFLRLLLFCLSARPSGSHPPLLIVWRRTWNLLVSGMGCTFAFNLRICRIFSNNNHKFRTFAVEGKSTTAAATDPQRFINEEDFQLSLGIVIIPRDDLARQRLLNPLQDNEQFKSVSKHPQGLLLLPPP